MIPSIFVSHGSPQILLDQSAAHDFLVQLGQEIPHPAAIVVFSAHWETRDLKITSSAAPATIHDFGGFDPALYRMTYPAPGDPTLAARIQSLLAAKGISATLDAGRGLDHGAWIPLMLAYPKADIPTLQISIPRGITPTAMSAIGDALSSLRDENILILGSGSLTHNLYAFEGQPLESDPAPWVYPFAEWIQARFAAQDVPALLNYRMQAPYARENHPTEEHLLPFFAALGAGQQTPQKQIHHSFNHAILAMDAYSFGRD